MYYSNDYSTIFSAPNAVNINSVNIYVIATSKMELFSYFQKHRLLFFPQYFNFDQTVLQLFSFEHYLRCFLAFFVVVDQ